MTVAATLVMLIVETFRFPNAALGGYYTILLARENLAITWRGVRMATLGSVVACLYTLLGMMLFRGYPVTHFFWVIASLYVVFFVMRTATNYGAALGFAFLIANTLAVWDSSLSSEIQVERTLWPVLVIATGTLVTVATEAVYRIFDRSDPLITSVDDLLLAVQQAAEGSASLHALPKSLHNKILQYDMIGTGRLRTALQRQGLEPTKRAQRSALISLAARLVGLAANFVHTTPQPGEDDASRLRALSERLRAIRTELHESGVISASTAVLVGQPSSGFPVLQEMERTVALITEVFHRDEIVDSSRSVPARDGWRALFLPDAFENREYQRFASAGCLAATVCYVIYNAIAWPGISTCIITCVVTALSTVGTSLQKQSLRIVGYVVGGLVMGVSAQILILPGIDSVFGFALFFAAGTAIAAWFATSSPRLSYLGLQIMLAFYFVNLTDARVQTDLTIARDKVVGVLLGLLAMALIFDRLGTKSDAEQLQKLLVRNVRMLAQLAVSPVVSSGAITALQLGRLRSQINDNFTSLASQMDAVQFEFQFHHRREQDVAKWEWAQRAQPDLRSIFVLELSLLSHRGRWENASELTSVQVQALDHFLTEFSGELMHTAAWMAHEEDAAAPRVLNDPIQRLQEAYEGHSTSNSQAILDICQQMVSSLVMLRRPTPGRQAKHKCDVDCAPSEPIRAEGFL
jgi:multidrug resistance protein MdtO